MTWSRVAAPAVLVIAAVAAVFGANAVLRPGCSLLPVALSSEQVVAQPETLEQACAALGRPLPQPATLPNGARLGGIGIDGPPPSGTDCCRMVNVSYAMNGRDFALMSVQRQDAIPPGNVGEINASLAGAPAVIKQTRRPNFDADDVSYLWARDGLLYGMHVMLVDGVTREAADAMAASIR